MKNESLYKKGPSVEHFPWPEIPNISQNKGGFTPIIVSADGGTSCQSCTLPILELVPEIFLFQGYDNELEPSLQA